MELKNAIKELEEKLADGIATEEEAAWLQALKVHQAND